MAGSALLDQKKHQKGATHLVDLLNLQLFGCYLFAFDAFSLPKAERVKDRKSGAMGLAPYSNGIYVELHGIAKYTMLYIYIDPYLIPNKYLSYIQLSDYSNYE